MSNANLDIINTIPIQSNESKCELVINGERHIIYVPHHWTLLEVLRYRLGLIGTKQGCDKGDCGACTVLINGQSVLSCLTLALEAEKQTITTIEGLASPEGLDEVQDAFDKCGALQCGFCQPGMMLSARQLIDDKLVADEHELELNEINEALGGNLCRCTGYTKIIEAVNVAFENSVPPTASSTVPNKEGAS